MRLPSKVVCGFTGGSIHWVLGGLILGTRGNRAWAKGSWLPVWGSQTLPAREGVQPLRLI
jgi:hypothetical protein